MARDECRFPEPGWSSVVTNIDKEETEEVRAAFAAFAKARADSLAESGGQIDATAESEFYSAILTRSKSTYKISDKVTRKIVAARRLECAIDAGTFRESTRKDAARSVLLKIYASIADMSAEDVAPTIVNPSGKIARIKPTAACPRANPWINIMNDPPLHIGLGVTTTGSQPRVAQIYVENPKQELVVLEGFYTPVKVGDGSYVYLTVSEVAECTVDFNVLANIPKT